MIRKSVKRFSEKIMLKELKRDDDLTQSHRALGNWSGCPIVARKWRNLDLSNDSQSQAWIEMAHRPLIEINDATRRERPYIIYLDDGLLACPLDEGIFRPRAVLNPAKLLAQI